MHIPVGAGRSGADIFHGNVDVIYAGFGTGPRQSRRIVHSGAGHHNQLARLNRSSIHGNRTTGTIHTHPGSTAAAGPSFQARVCCIIKNTQLRPGGHPVSIIGPVSIRIGRSSTPIHIRIRRVSTRRTLLGIRGRAIGIQRQRIHSTYGRRIDAAIVLEV
ncbi:MAG: hypothetical protein BWY71_02226 [Planctomycetes bacterium ADurb.Bin412]|nr:MAG: hypothetical protein BWY71_02226 [Planctomycetes bacterium ADurb.Bin412]